MDEATWLACTDPQPMLDFAKETASERKQRLCAVAWVRAFLSYADTNSRMANYREWLDPPHWASQLETAEQFADQQITAKVFRASRQESGGPYNVFREACRISEFSLANLYSRSMRWVLDEFSVPSGIEMASLLRDIVGNPYRPVAIEPGWLTWNDGTVVKLAQAIYDERQLPSRHLDSGRLAILADALEEAGCHNDDILSHFRSANPHVRGCHVVDALLGKE